MNRAKIYRWALSVLILPALCMNCAARIPAGELAPGATSTATFTPQPTNVHKPRKTQTGGEPAKNEETPPADTDFNLILGSPTADSVVLSLYSTAQHTVNIEYGLTTGNYTNKVGEWELNAGEPVFINLTGLHADSEYYYAVIRDGQTLPEHAFHTQRKAGDGFTFTIDADPHHRDPSFSSELYAVTLDNILADRPDFHINLGDTFMNEKSKELSLADTESSFVEMRPYFGLIGGDVPLFLVNGNHEGELGWYATGKKAPELPLWSARMREKYYPNPVPGGFYSGSTSIDPAMGAERDGYYAFTWGEALFVVLDPFWYTSSKPHPDDLNSNWNWTLGREQYDWLKSTLSGSSAKYKFVFIHHLVGGNNTDARGGIEAAPYFEWGGQNADGTDGFAQHRPGWGESIHQMLVENHVNAVFHGHDHVYVKQDLDGIIYQEVPQPSMARYDNTQLAEEYAYTHGVVYGSSGHLRVTVSAGGVKVDYVRAYLPGDITSDRQNRQVTYSYTIH